MRITDPSFRPPSCLSSLRITRAEGEFRRKFIEQFISDADIVEPARTRSGAQP